MRVIIKKETIMDHKFSIGPSAIENVDLKQVDKSTSIFQALQESSVLVADCMEGFFWYICVNLGLSPVL